MLPGIGSLHSRRSDRPVPIASLAKVATALVVLRDHPLLGRGPGDLLRVSAAEAADYVARQGTGQSLLPVRAGEQLTERQALQGLLLPSADNIADVLARWDGGRARVLARMNALARRAGARHTRYTDPSGLDPSTVSTADDQARIARLALASPALMSVVAERSAVLPVAGLVRNYNALLSREDVFGIKTGSTTAAGGCLLFAARQRLFGHSVLVVGALLGVDAGVPAPLLDLRVALRSASGLLDRVRRDVVQGNVAPPGAGVALLRTGWGATTTVVTTAPTRALLLKGARPSAVAHVRCRNVPVRSGQACGVLLLTVGDDLSGTQSYLVRLTASGGLSQPPVLWRLRARLPW